VDYDLGRPDSEKTNNVTAADIDPQLLADVAVKVAAAVRQVIDESMIEDFLRSLQPVFDSLNWLRERAPLNWPAVEDLETAYSVMKAGIPLVFVPNRALVGTLLSAESYDERVEILRAHVPDVVRDCREALNGHQLHAEVDDAGQLIVEVLAALEIGHYRSAQALAVCVCDGLLLRMLKTKNYERMKQHVKNADLDEAINGRLFRSELALMPILSFLTPWDALGPKQPPRRLSRHVTVHGGRLEHFSEGNAILAAMLAVSLALGVSEWLHVATFVTD
jgi:hypothetical protein